MSLPAAHRRNQQAAVKMVETKGLSLRGGRRPTWQSREGTCSSYKPLLKWCAPIASVAALSERHWQLQISVYPADRTGHQICHCEEAVGRRGNLGKALPEWERHRRPYTPPGLTVAALSERHWQLQISVYPADRTGHQICHCEEAVGRRGNLGKALPEWERHRRPYTPPGLTVAALSERHAGWQSLRHAFCGARPSSLSLRGPNGAVAP